MVVDETQRLRVEEVIGREFLYLFPYTWISYIQLILVIPLIIYMYLLYYVFSFTTTCFSGLEILGERTQPACVPALINPFFSSCHQPPPWNLPPST